MKESIKIRGIVEIKNGKTHIVAENHFTDEMMKMLVSFLAAKAEDQVDRPLPTSSWNMYIGTDTDTATTHSMTQLVSPIGTAPGTEPNSKSGALTNPSPGVWRVVYSATWDAGTVSGTVGEVALYLTTTDHFSFEDSNWYCNAGANMVSRLSVADSAFSAFTIDESKPFTVTWTIEISSS